MSIKVGTKVKVTGFLRLFFGDSVLIVSAVSPDSLNKELEYTNVLCINSETGSRYWLNENILEVIE